jgi:hypothetical protein
MSSPGAELLGSYRVSAQKSTSPMYAAILNDAFCTHPPCKWRFKTWLPMSTIAKGISWTEKNISRVGNYNLSSKFDSLAFFSHLHSFGCTYECMTDKKLQEIDWKSQHTWIPCHQENKAKSGKEKC